MAVTETGRVGLALEQAYVILRDAEQVDLDIGATGLEKSTPHRGQQHFRFQLLPRPGGVIYGHSIRDDRPDLGLQLLLTTERVRVGFGAPPNFAIKVTGRLTLHPDEFRGLSSGAAYSIEEDIHEGYLKWMVLNTEEFREREKSLRDLLTLGLEPMTSRLEEEGGHLWL